MAESSPFAIDPREPYDLWARDVAAPESLTGLRVRRLEFTSRGDRVPMRLLLPAEGDGPFPLVLFQHGAGGSKDADYIDLTVAPWVRAGAAVASIDFPLFGERFSGKLTERLLTDMLEQRAEGRVPEDRVWREFVVQAVHDLRRSLGALAQQPEVDADRCVYGAYSLGAMVGAVFLAHDPRPRAAVLAVGGGGFGPADVDPARHIGGFAPRPLLLVNATRDERVPRASSEALFDAAGEPKQIEWFEAGHATLPGRALKAMWTFLREHLELA